MDAREARDLRDTDARHVWHPYTQMLEYPDQAPVIVERAEGVRVQDVDGAWYYDGVSSIWLNVHGHRVPEIDAAIQDQLGRVAHTTLLGQGNVPSIRLAERLVDVAPKGLGHVFYSDNGSCANEAALKMSLQHWHARGRPEKRRFVAFEGGYHGETMGLVGIAPVPTFHAPFLAGLGAPLLAPFPDCYRSEGTQHPARCADGHLRAVESVLRRHHKEVAGFFVEPIVQGVAGMRVMPPGFLRGVRELCDRYDVHLIADEVATGFGRTARLWACDHEGVRPDLLTTGKGITGGYLPLAATLATDDIYESFLGRFEEKKTFFHGHSYAGNQLACAAAIASLDLLVRRLPEIEENAHHLDRLLRPFVGLPLVGDVRGVGFMRGIELVQEKAKKTAFPWEARAGWKVAAEARKRGLLVRPIGSTSLLLPPLASTREQLEEMVRILFEAHEAAAPALAAARMTATATVSG